MPAVMGFLAAWDTFTQARGKNAYFYRPKGGKWMLIHWDGDRVFGNAGETFLGGLSGIRTYFDKPYIKCNDTEISASLIPNIFFVVMLLFFTYVAS